MNALLYFHQGWTDIINCLPMINIYAAKYRLLYLLVRRDAWALIQFYIRGLRNVIPVYSPHLDLNRLGISVVDIAHHKITHLELMGHHDGSRFPDDPLRNAFTRYDTANNEQLSDGRMKLTFERVFYEAYGIPYSDRVDKFVLYRDPVLEETVYNRVVKSKPYICVHSNPALNLMVCPKTTLPRIELNQASEIFFDYLRILQHAEEIHVIDSVWAGLCYLMDAKYGVFHEKPVYVYCYRDFHRMFSEPVKLPNWTIIMADDACKQRDTTGVAFVSFASGTYTEPQKLFVESVQKHNPEIPVFAFTDFGHIGSPTHKDNPYAFKVYAVDTLRKFGYKTIIWCDSVLRLTQPIDTLLPEIHEKGVYLQKDGWNSAQWANDKCLDYFGLTRDQAESIESVYACFMAFDFTNPATETFFARWKKSCDDGIFRGAWNNNAKTESQDPRCRGHRHDQVCAEILSYQLNIPRGECRVKPGNADDSTRYFTTWKHL
jgi:hypothetical protein